MKITTGIFPNKNRLTTIVGELKSIGVSDSEISCIYTDDTGIHDSQTVEKMEESGLAGATAGAAIGAIAGIIVANGIVPGVGTLFVAGPLAEIFGLGMAGAIATTAAGAAAGAVTIGIASALMEIGVDDQDAALYEESVKKGEVIVIVKSQIELVKNIMTENGASKTNEYSA